MSDFFTMHSGETAAPVPPGPMLCMATAEMRRIHRVFLWYYSEAPGLARSVADGDTARSAFVGNSMATFDKLLHLHHEGEDEIMYPRLSERAPACALHVAQMLAHHREVGRLLKDLAPIRDEWAVTADARLGEDLAKRYQHLDEVLQVHLRREVTEVTPAVDKVLTPDEVQEMADHSVGGFETRVVLANLGLVLASNPPEEQHALFQNLPLMIRLIYRVVGRRLYEKQYSTLFPGRPIPATL